MLVQTWGCQAHRDSSFCVENKHQVENIKSIRTDLGNWKATVDHSKWCVAKDPKKHWTCLADVNRALTQYERRGGALCIESEAIKNRFLQFVESSEDCKDKQSMDIVDTDCGP